MQNVSGVIFREGSREELLPDYREDFPCITTRYIPVPAVENPWHWHRAVELFYIPRGQLDYSTPDGVLSFREGTGGFVNANVPHSTLSHTDGTIQLLHLFDPMLISGIPGSRIEQKYVLPLTASGVEILALDSKDPLQGEALRLLESTFRLNPSEPGYELLLREALSRLWLLLLDAFAPQLERPGKTSRISEYLKEMLVFIHEHYSEKLSVDQIAEAAGISQRRCFQIFKSYLHTTPVEYLNHYRIQAACTLLRRTEDSVTDIALACGMGSSSHFCTQFREATGLTPLEFRKQERSRRP